MQEIYAILMAWAVHLSGYPLPDVVPPVYRVPHEFFVKNACGGNECKVLGWTSGKGVYIDNTLNVKENLQDASILVHEFVHILQYDHLGIDGALPCDMALLMERQAYGVQQAFFTAYGVYAPQSAVPTHMECI